MGHLIGARIRMGVVPLRHTGAFDEGFSSDCDVISGSQRGHSRVRVMSPWNHCRVTVMSEGHSEATGTDHSNSDFEIETFDWSNRANRCSKNYSRPGGKRETTRIRGHPNALNCIL